MKQCGKEVTPNLNRLAQEGCVFNRAYTSSPICVPARTALATGKYPTKNKVVFNDWKAIRASDHKPIHQFLGEAGYRLAHSGVNHIVLKPGLKERVSFEKFIEVEDYHKYLKNNEISLKNLPLSSKEVLELHEGVYEKASYSSTKTYLWEEPVKFFKDVYFTEQAIEFLDVVKSDSDPFALFVNIWAPHPPLQVPEPFASMYDPNQVELASNVGIPSSGEPANRRKGMPAQLADGVTMDEWKKTWAAHLGLTSLADDCIGRVIDTLKQNNQYENTIILIMSDHGEQLGQHNMYQKMEMYEQAVRVPMIIKVPGEKPHAVHDVVSHLDILPTILDYIGEKPAEDLDGVSLRSAISGKSNLSGRYVYSQYSGNPVVGDIRRAIISEQFKYIYDPTDTPELYDLEQDPLEMKNLAFDDNYSEIKYKMHDALIQWAIDHEDWIR